MVAPIVKVAPVVCAALSSEAVRPTPIVHRALRRSCRAENLPLRKAPRPGLKAFRSRAVGLRAMGSRAQRYVGAGLFLLVDLRDVKPTLLDYLGIADDSSRGRSLLALLRAGAGQSLALPAPEPRPARDGSQHGGENIIGGQAPETTKELARELRALGYIVD